MFGKKFSYQETRQLLQLAIECLRTYNLDYSFQYFFQKFMNGKLQKKIKIYMKYIKFC
ncbi:hypothetical protein pb186bvf_008400 [Paramecium bursaria]